MPVLAAVALSLGGCGSLTGRPVRPTNISQDELSAGPEPYFWAGPVTYQVQISRELNPFDVADVPYFAGVTDAQTIPSGPNGYFWYGVFLWAKNQSGHVAPTTDTFRIVDASGAAYSPTPLNPSINPYAWAPERLSPDGVEPTPDSTAGLGPNGGGLVLFKLPYSVYSNRPLTLQVYAPGASSPSRVSLDL